MGDLKSDLKARLEAARAKRAELRQEAELDDAEAKLQAEVEFEEQAAIDDAALLKARKEHGRRRVLSIPTDMGAIVLKAPHDLLFRKWQDTEDSARSQALEELVRPCIVHPDASRVDRILAELPATLKRLGDAVVVLAGYRKDDFEKKS